jgi:iron complex transport system permease protein
MISSPLRAARARLRSTRARAELAWERFVSSRPSLWVPLFSFALLLAVLFAAGLGAAAIPLRELPGALADPEHPGHAALWQVRLPRIVVATLAGGALAVAGALMQTVVRNPLADPALIGVTAGAGLAALLGIVLLPEVSLLLPFLAFAGGLLATAVVLLASWNGPSAVGPLRIILSGVAIQSIFFAGIALVTFFFADRAPAFVAFTVGSLNGSGWREVRIALGPTLVGIAAALAAVRPLNLLLLDDDSAMGIGLGVRSARVIAASLSALLAAGAVSVAGLVGFVGLVVPNGIRLLAGPDHARLLPLSALAGATLVVLADAAARTLAAPLELPVGAVLALVGGPYFLTILWRKLA